MDEGKGIADDIVKWCKKHSDLSVERTSKGHIKVNVDGHGDMKGKRIMVITAGTASDHRSDLNFRGDDEAEAQGDGLVSKRDR